MIFKPLTAAAWAPGCRSAGGRHDLLVAVYLWALEGPGGYTVHPATGRVETVKWERKGH